LMTIARYIAEQQVRQIATAIENRRARLQTFAPASSECAPVVVLSGSGAWLAERALQQIDEPRFGPVSNLATMFVRNVSPCAPAFAVARLAAERCFDDLLPLTLV
jgi:uncharacterized hydantoinase/oxoprolinase family protein